MSGKNPADMTMAELEAHVASERERLTTAQTGKRKRLMLELSGIQNELKSIGEHPTAPAVSQHWEQVRAEPAVVTTASDGLAQGLAQVADNFLFFRTAVNPPSKDVATVKALCLSFVKHYKIEIGLKNIRVNLFFKGKDFRPYTSGRMSMKEFNKLQNGMFADMIDSWANSQQRYDERVRWECSAIELVIG